jgi:hypothetical protein
LAVSWLVVDASYAFRRTDDAAAHTSTADHTSVHRGIAALFVVAAFCCAVVLVIAICGIETLRLFADATSSCATRALVSAGTLRSAGAPLTPRSPTSAGGLSPHRSVVFCIADFVLVESNEQSTSRKGD